MADNFVKQLAKEISFRKGSEWATLDYSVVSQNNAFVYNSNNWEPMALGTGIYYEIQAPAVEVGSMIIMPLEDQRVQRYQFAYAPVDNSIVYNGVNLGVGSSVSISPLTINDSGTSPTYEFTYVDTPSAMTQFNFFIPNVSPSGAIVFVGTRGLPLVRLKPEAITLAGSGTMGSIAIMGNMVSATTQEWTEYMDYYQQYICTEFAGYVANAQKNVTMIIRIEANSAITSSAAYDFFRSTIVSTCRTNSNGHLTIMPQIETY